MLKRLYVDNVRCLTNFELKPDRVAAIVGPNGGGKSTVFDVLGALQTLHGPGGATVQTLFPALSRTRWDARPVQRIELEAQASGGASYRYSLELLHDLERGKTVIHDERLMSEGDLLYRQAEGEVELFGDEAGQGVRAKFPVDPQRSFLSVLESRRSNPRIGDFKQWLGGIWLFRLRPERIEADTRGEADVLATDGSNFASWYRTLQQESPQIVERVRKHIEPLILGFSRLRLVKLGAEAKFVACDCEIAGKGFTLSFGELSEGQRILTVLYTVLEAVADRASLLVFELICCGECGHKMQTQYKGGARYLCNHHRFTMQLPVCQFLPADPIDQHVVKAFFDALSPAEVDLYAKAIQSRESQWAQVETAQQRELQRLRYEVDLARRQYDRVDPDNRLVASKLEHRWESALRELHQAEERIEQQRRERNKVVPLRVSRDLREAFSSLGQSLPQLWSRDVLTREQRKALLRCLIDKVVVRRKEQREIVYTRIVWRGGAVTEIDVPVTVKAVSDLSCFEAMQKLILELESQGMSDEDIAASLTGQGFRSPMHDRLLPSTVQTIRLRHQRVHRFHGPRPRRVEGRLTLPQLAKRLDVKPHWLYHLINRGVIKAKVDRATRLYLFPDSPKLIADLRRLRARTAARVSPRKEHQDA